MGSRIAVFISLVIASGLVHCSTSPKKNTDQGGAPPEKTEIQSRTRKILEDFVSSARTNRSVGLPGHVAAEIYLRNFLKHLAQVSGGAFSEETFKPDVNFAIQSYKKDFETLVRSKFKPTDPTFQKWDAFTKKAIRFVKGFKNKKGRNFVLDMPGGVATDQAVYIGAHYDTITHDHETLEFKLDDSAPGADDNGSGVAAALAAAEYFSRHSHARPLRFIFFDDEEIFFLGSYAYAKAHKAEASQALGLVNLEMLGWSTKQVNGKSVMKIYGRKPDETGSIQDAMLARKFKDAAALQETLEPVFLQNGFNRSDNWPFWIWGFAAICVSEDWENDFNENNYHTPNDRPGTLNYSFLASATEALIHFLER